MILKKNIEHLCYLHGQLPATNGLEEMRTWNED